MPACSREFPLRLEVGAASAAQGTSREFGAALVLCARKASTNSLELDVRPDFDVSRTVAVKARPKKSAVTIVVEEHRRLAVKIVRVAMLRIPGPWLPQ